MDEHGTYSSGSYDRVPGAAPLSMEMFVERNANLSRAYHGYKKALEEDAEHQSNSWYNNLYNTLKRPAPGTSKTKTAGVGYITDAGKVKWAEQKKKDDAEEKKREDEEIETRRKQRIEKKKKEKEEKKKAKEERKKKAAEEKKKRKEQKEKERKEKQAAGQTVENEEEEEEEEEEEADNESEELEEEEVEEKRKVVRKGPKRVRLVLPDEE
ncbi:hypothetical protein PFICI_03414 [Pestalotiopsis fici W106-1]|uniref:Uncharacterized protein n=1 Tax=Pestalotiopsis fici (strain W106-1 / CGMCC3.15140) TaxID=1229662 RepID=W3XHC0_PESFW|nr:uncharacterized protein PFICI_03414 [Pestalotiopsis fici W106-1]ETS85389.1 hypothetical protein PFICI_03414 [Pestalotiopsis fici W106-1]